MTALLQAIVDGLLYGGLLALIAVGFTLVWGVLNVVNLAHGALVVLGAYLTYELGATLGLNAVLAGAVSVVAMFAIGYILQRGLLNLVARAPVLLTLLVTFGVGLLITDAMVAAFSSDDRALHTSYSLSYWVIGGIYIPTERLAALAVSVLVLTAVAIYVMHTRTGLCVRAVGMDRDAARLMGIQVRHVYALTLGIASALAGTAGALISVVNTFSPGSASTYTLESFVIAVLGGVGNIWGSLAGGLLLGVLEALAAQYLPGTLVNAIAVAALVLILLVRPRGVVGTARFAGRADR